MKVMRQCLWILVVASAPLAMAADKVPYASPYAALMELSGLNGQLGGYGAQFTGMIAAEMKGVVADEQRLNQLKAAATRCFEKASFLSDIESGVQKDLIEADCTAVLAWLESPLGAKFTAAEKAAGKADSGEIDTFAADADGIPEERETLVRQLGAAMGGIDSRLAMQMQLETSLEFARALATSGSDSVSLQEIEGRIKARMADRRADLEASGLIYALFLYRTFSDEDLRAYLAFAASEPGKKYHQVVNASVHAALAARHSTYNGELRRLFSGLGAGL